MTPQSAWRRALDFLGLPVAPMAPPDPPKGSGRRFTVSPSWAQSLREAEAVVQAMAAERTEAMRSIATHGERREALLLQPDSDDKIVRLGIEIDRANATLERHDVVMPGLLERLGEIKIQARAVRVKEWRDKWAAVFEQYADREPAYQAFYDEWRAARDECVREFYTGVYVEHQAGAPDPSQTIPHPAPLRPYTMDYAAQLAAFRNIELVPSAPPPPAGLLSLQGFIDDARMYGRIDARCPLIWRQDVESAMRPTVQIELLLQWIDAEGVTHPKGAVIEMSYEDAQRRVQSGYARHVG